MIHPTIQLRSIPGCVLLALMGTCAFRPACAGPGFDMRTISSRPDTVSGGDVLVEVNAPNRSKWTAHLNGHGVTPSFRLAEGSGKLLALLPGLNSGKNLLTVRVSGTIKSKLEMLNHPLTGPIFSGPHQKPFVCETMANGLGPALDSDCNAKTVIQYYYKSTEPVQVSPVQAITAAFEVTPGISVPDLSHMIPPAHLPPMSRRP
jgi:hypothetical protein